MARAPRLGKGQAEVITLVGGGSNAESASCDLHERTHGIGLRRGRSHPGGAPNHAFAQVAPARRVDFSRLSKSLRRERQAPCLGRGTRQRQCRTWSIGGASFERLRWSSGQRPTNDSTTTKLNIQPMCLPQLPTAWPTSGVRICQRCNRDDLSTGALRGECGRRNGH